jgi:hypothetical protein
VFEEMGLSDRLRGIGPLKTTDEEAIIARTGVLGKQGIYGCFLPVG